MKYEYTITKEVGEAEGQSHRRGQPGTVVAGPQ